MSPCSTYALCRDLKMWKKLKSNLPVCALQLYRCSDDLSLKYVYRLQVIYVVICLKCDQIIGLGWVFCRLGYLQSKINFLPSLSNIHTTGLAVCSIINGNGEKDRGNVIFIYSRKYVSMNLPMLECDQITGLNMFRFGFFCRLGRHLCGRGQEGRRRG